MLTEDCVPSDTCQEFQLDQERLNKLQQSSPERAALLEDMRSRVCNKEERKVCCKNNGRSSNQLYVTKTYSRFTIPLTINVI